MNRDTKIEDKLKVILTVGVKIEPFHIPTQVGVESSSNKWIMDTISVKDLDADTLNYLCDQFKRSVFKKACIEMPSRVECIKS